MEIEQDIIGIYWDMDMIRYNLFNQLYNMKIYGGIIDTIGILECTKPTIGYSGLFENAGRDARKWQFLRHTQTFFFHGLADGRSEISLLNSQ